MEPTVILPMPSPLRKGSLSLGKRCLAPGGGGGGEERGSHTGTMVQEERMSCILRGEAGPKPGLAARRRY